VEGTRVRRLEERDIDAAVALTDLEAWGYTPADFRRLLDLSPQGCFVAELDGRVVGVLTTTAYGPLAFLGAVIVAPDLRGKGVGQQMMEAALRHLRDAGVRTVRLYAYLNAVRFYERLGFHREYEVIRWHGAATAGAGIRGVRPMRPADLDGLVRMDTTYFGSDRRALIAWLAEEFSNTFFVAERAGHLRGFIVGNPGGTSYEIGPWVVEPTSDRVAEALFDALIGTAGASEVALSGPSRNRALLDFTQTHRFNEVFRALRMWWGSDESRGNPEGIWALGGLEKG
jgi:GNAT superfamily N-acetyltransferase